jgi:hypothetical protein
MRKKLIITAAFLLIAGAVFAQTYMTGCTATVTGLREYNGKYAYVIATAEKSGLGITGMSPQGTPCLISGGKVTIPLFYSSEEDGFKSFDGNEALAANYYMFITDDGKAVLAEYDEPATYRTLLFDKALKFSKGKASVRAGEVISGVADADTARENSAASQAGKAVGDAAKNDAGEVANEARNAAKDVVKEEVRDGAKKWVKGLFN